MSILAVLITGQSHH